MIDLVCVARWTPSGSENFIPPRPTQFPAALDLLRSGYEMPVLIEDVSSFTSPQMQDVVKQAVDAGFGGFGVLPLRAGGTWLGIMTAAWDKPQSLRPAEVDAVQSVQPMVASIAARRRSELLAQEALADNAALLELSITLNTAQSIQDLTERAAKVILAPEASMMSLMLYEGLDYDSAQTVTMAGTYARFPNPMITMGEAQPLTRFPAIRSLYDKEVVVYDDLEVDAPSDARRSDLMAMGIRAILVAPLVYGGRLFGQVIAMSHSKRRHAEREIRLMRAAAEQIAAAIERLTLLEQAERRARDLDIVRRVTTATATILDTDTMLTRVCDLTKEGFDLYHVHIYLLDDDGKRLVLRAGAGAPGRIMRERGHAIAANSPRSLVARAARTRSAVIVNDVSQVQDFLPNPLLPETRSEMAVPMIVGDRLLGVMDVQSTQTERFQEADIDVKTALGEQVSVAVQNALLYAREVETTAQLRELDRLKSEFLASMSHELRTPLNSILGYAEVLADGIDGELPEEAVIDVGAIHESGQHLLGLINDILDLSKIEAGHMELDLESLPLSEVVEDIARIVPALIREKPVIFVKDVPGALPHLLADRQRLRQILTNLVSNAIKFTDRGSIRVEAVQKADQVEITVRDTGTGIAPEHLGLIFEQFRQVDNSSTRRVGGTGLGLPITQRLVRMHGGDIRVESTPDSGSAFIFTIPAASEVVGS